VYRWSGSWDYSKSVTPWFHTTAFTLPKAMAQRVDPTPERIANIEIWFKQGIYDKNSTDDNDVRLCLGCLRIAAGAILEIDQRTRASELMWRRTLRKKYAHVWTQIMAFITCPRDEPEMRAMDASILALSARCPHSQAASEGHALKNGSPPTLLAICCLSELVYRCLLDSDEKGTTPMPVPFSTTGLWPTKMTELHPRGPPLSIAVALELWTLCAGEYIVMLLTALVQTCPSVMAPLLVEMRDVFVPVLCQNLQWAAQLLIAATPSSTEGAWINMGAHLRFLRIIENLPVRACLKIFAGCQEIFGPMLCEVRRAITTHPPAPGIHTMDSNAGGFIARALMIPEPPVPPTGRQEYVAALPSSKDHYTRFLSHFVGLRGDVHCDLPSCNFQPQGAADRPLRCAGCGVGQYCSRACQKAHWKHPIIPHKEVCPLFDKIRVLTAGRWDDYVAFSDACKAEKISDDRLAECLFHAVALSQKDVPEDPAQRAVMTASVLQCSLSVRTSC
jgi:hypothetical protein